MRISDWSSDVCSSDLTESWEDFKDGSARVEQVVYVGRDQHKAICLGKGGKTIRLVRQAAQKDMEEEFGQPVHLFIFVKVRETWLEDPESSSNLGLEFDSYAPCLGTPAMRWMGVEASG